MAVRKQRADGESERLNIPILSPSPPRPNRWQLILSGFFLAAWLFFLAWMAFSS